MARFHPYTVSSATGCRAPKAVIRRTADRRLKSTLSSHSLALLDDLVGADEQQRRDRQAERCGRLEVDDQLELHRLLDR